VNIEMLSRPNVAVSPGLRLDDRTAGSIVDRMLDALDYDLDRTSLIGSAVMQGGSSSLGNPKGQERFAKRFIRALGSMLIAPPDISYGTRKRFRMFFDIFDVRHDNRGRRWLMLMQLCIVGEGVSKQIDRTEIPLLMLTRHALIRLVQRSECRAPEDLVKVLRHVVPLALTATWASAGHEHLPIGSKSGWLIPVYPIDLDAIATDTSRLSYLVLRQAVEGEKSYAVPIVVTALDGSMIQDHSALAPLFALLSAPAKDLEPSDQFAWRAAFQATTKATRMGRRET
jgi:hypothetical protein